MIDWEAYWNAVGYTTTVIRILTSGLLFGKFVNPFLINRKCSYFCGITYSITMLVMQLYPNEIDSLIVRAITGIIVFFVMCTNDRRNTRQKIFLTVTWCLQEWIVWGVVLIPWNGLYEITIMPPVMMRHPYLQFILFVALEALYIILEYFGLKLFTKLIHTIYAYKKEEMSGKELALMLAPSLSMYVGHGILHFFSLIYEKDTKQLIWDIYPKYHWIQTLYMLISFGAILTAIFSYQRIRASQKRETEDAVLSQQLEDMERHIHEVEKLYLDIRSLKHDMGNHIMILEHLYMDKTKEKEAEKYLAKLKEQINKATLKIKSGNPVADVILNEKQKAAEEEGIIFKCEFYYPSSKEISAFDIGVVLSNAINNALEAARECEKPYVKISSYQKKNTYFIEIRNSAAQIHPLHKDTGLLPSTKAGGEHGFGLMNIRRIAWNYHGDIAIQQTAGEFVLDVMLLLGTVKK